MNQTGKEEIIRGIEADVRREAEKIASDAERAAEARRQAARTQAASIIEEARVKARQQAEAIRRSVASATAVEIRRIGLRVREESILRILDQARRELRERIARPGYRDVLLGWIVEAAIGLGADEAEVNASREEIALIDDALLRKAEARVAELTGRTVRLSRSASPPLAPQGVLLSAPGGRIAYNNQVPTRLLRNQSEIRRLIHEELFS